MDIDNIHVGDGSNYVVLSTGECITYDDFPIWVFEGGIEFGYGDHEVILFLEPDIPGGRTCEASLEAFERFWPDRERWRDEAIAYAVELLGSQAEGDLESELVFDAMTVMPSGMIELLFNTETVMDGKNIVVQFRTDTGMLKCWIEPTPEILN